MDYRQALNLTFDTFKVKAADIADLSGVDVSRLSKFRNGHHDLYAKALIDVINALPPGARAYYYLLLMNNAAEKDSQRAA